MQFLSKALWIIVTVSPLLNGQIHAHCARCERIEKERAIEQTKNPKPAGYYDDQISLHSSTEETSSSDDSLSDTKTRSDTKKNLNNTNQRHPTNKKKPSKTSPDSQDSTSNLSQLYLEENLNLFEASYLAQNTSNTERFEKTGNSQANTNSTSFNRNEESNSPREGNASSLPEDRAYSTLLTALKTRLFLETLDGSFTLFIPTNAALRKLPPGTLIELAGPENQEKLAALISNHVVAKKILRKDFEALEDQEIKAISGRNLMIHAHNGQLTVNGAQILRIEPAGYDGVIYIIDKVLIP